jgi:ABC-2 type transport system permease protein
MNLTLLGFWKKEFMQALRDNRMRLLIFGAPIIQVALFGLAISNEVKNLKFAVYARPNDAVAIKINEKTLSSKWFLPSSGVDIDPFHLVQSGKADVVVVAPPEGITKSMERGDGKLQLLINATNAVSARSVELYMKSIINDAVADHYKKEPGSLPVTFDIRLLYNPAMESAIFMVPGIMCLILCLVTIILTSMALAKEKEIGTYEMIISTPIKRWEILLGKTIPFVVLGMADVIIVLVVGVLLFHVPVKGSLVLLFLSAFVFVCTTVSVGTLISTIANTQQQAMMGGFLFLFPAIMFSGFIFPVENMPTALKFLAYLDPVKYFVTLLRNIMLKGGDPYVVFINVLILIGFGAFAVMFSYRRFKHSLN